MTVRRWRLTLSVAVILFAGLELRGLRAAPSAANAVVAAAAQPMAVFIDDVGRSIALPVPLQRTVVFNRYTTEFIRAVAGMSVVVLRYSDSGHS